MPDSTLVVTPAYNEVRSVGQVVQRVRLQGFRCVVVDDGSTDGTDMAARLAGATVLRLPVNLGVGAALQTGFRYAVSHGYKRVVQVDADLQHPPEQIRALLECADRGVELVIGSRFRSGYEAGARRLGMRLLAAVATRRVGAEIADPTSGFKVVSEPLLSEFARNYPAEYLGDTVEALLQAGAVGASIMEVDVEMARRRDGVPTPTSKAIAHFGRVLLAILSGKPGRARR